VVIRITTTYSKAGAFYIACIGDLALIEKAVTSQLAAITLPESRFYGNLNTSRRQTGGDYRLLAHKGVPSENGPSHG
jgi:hypothetical protein